MQSDAQILRAASLATTTTSIDSSQAAVDVDIESSLGMNDDGSAELFEDLDAEVDKLITSLNYL